jgi:hypothetical protein
VEFEFGQTSFSEHHFFSFSAMDLDGQWQKFSLVNESSLIAQPRRFRVSFGVFLAVLVACGTLLGSVVVGALMYTATQDGNAVLAQDLQSVTSANMVQLLGTLAVIPIENLAVLASVLRLQAEVRGGYVSPANPDLQRILFGHSLAVFDGVFMGFPDGSVNGYRGSASASFQYINSTTNPNGTFSVSIYATNSSSGVPVGAPVMTFQNVDVRTMEWYVAAANAPRSSVVSWTAARVLGSCSCLGLTAARAVYVN